MVGLGARLDKIEAIDRGKPRKNITILGAGMAGLVAGYELKRLGHRVRIYEGSDRVGGRVHTHRFADGTHGELGAMRIPLHHHYTRYYVQQMGLELRKFVTSHENLECFYDIKGTIVRMKDAPRKLYQMFDLSEDQRDLPIPPAMFAEARDQLVRSLTDQERADMLSTHTASSRLTALDQICLGDFLCQRIGRSAAELVGAATGFEAFFDRSVTMFLRDAVSTTKRVTYDEIVQGMDALPIALSTFLKKEIEFNTEISGLFKNVGEPVRVLLRRPDASSELRFSTPVICTLPFTVLRSLPHGLQLSPEKQKVIQRLGYTSSTKVLLHASERFWEKKYGIFGGASQTDTLIGALYYPSDFVQVVRAAQPIGQYGGLYTGFVDGRFATSAGVASRGVLLGSYTWGADAKRLGALSPDDRLGRVISGIARFHPEVACGGVIDDHRSIFWDESRWLRGGTFSYLEPHQQFGMVAEASRSEENLYFAGEHCSLDNAWIQGAIASAIDVVQAIASSR